MMPCTMWLEIAILALTFVIFALFDAFTKACERL